MRCVAELRGVVCRWRRALLVALERRAFYAQRHRVKRSSLEVRKHVGAEKLFMLSEDKHTSIQHVGRCIMQWPVASSIWQECDRAM